MSCPYLERGAIARCRATGNFGLQIAAGEGEVDCYSGEFSDCVFLVGPAGSRASRKSPSQASPGAALHRGRGRAREFRIEAAQ